MNNIYQYSFLLLLVLVSGYFSMTLIKDFGNCMDSNNPPIMYVTKLMSCLTIFVFVVTFLAVDIFLYAWNFLGNIG